MEKPKNRPCPKCRESGHDSTGDHMFQMKDGLTWTCRHVEYHSDGEVFFEGGKKHAKEDEDVPKCETMDLLKLLGGDQPDDIALPVSHNATTGNVDLVENLRGIYPATFKKYKTKCSLGNSGEVLSLSHTLFDTFGKPVCDKVRKMPKDFFTTAKTKGIPLQLFGMDITPSAKRVLIVEGELDAMSAYQMLYKYRVAVWSLPLGANKKALMDNAGKLNKCMKGNKELLFCLDNDDVGGKLSKELASLFPKAKFLSLERKDANDYLDPNHPDGPDEEAFVSAFWDAEIYKPPSIVRVSDIMDDILKKPELGREFPWPTLTEATYGRRDGEGMFVGAGVKAGKSEFINQLISYDVSHGWPIAAVKFEELPKMTVKRIAGKMDMKFYHKPGCVYSDADLRATAEAIDPHLLLHSAFGDASNSRWDSTKEFIRYSVGMGCKTVIIDPITKITNGMTPSETETELRRFADELACMAQDMGFFYIVTCHLKAPASGPSHERGGKVETYQFRGSRAMAENCYYFLGIQRNKDPDLPEIERNTSTFVLLEDRAFGNVCKFNVFYDTDNQSYLEPTGGGIF